MSSKLEPRTPELDSWSVGSRICVLRSDDYVSAQRQLRTLPALDVGVAIGWDLFMATGLSLVPDIEKDGRLPILDLGLLTSGCEIYRTLGVAAALGVRAVTIDSRAFNNDLELDRSIAVLAKLARIDDGATPPQVLANRHQTAADNGAKGVIYPTGCVAGIKVADVLEFSAMQSLCSYELTSSAESTSAAPD